MGAIHFGSLWGKKNSLAANGERSLVIDFADTALMPEGWETVALQKPRLKAFTDIAIYELHIRDFRFSLSILLSHLLTSQSFSTIQTNAIFCLVFVSVSQILLLILQFKAGILPFPRR
jgi:pullulanase/glycogen debranching enzyme